MTGEATPPHACPLEAAYAAAEALLQAHSRHHKELPAALAVCALRRQTLESVRTTSAQQGRPCTEYATDRDGWRVCPFTGAVSAAVEMAVVASGSAVTVDLAGIGKELDAPDSSASSPNRHHPVGQYL